MKGCLRLVLFFLAITQAFSQPLSGATASQFVTDPILTYSTYLGGSGGSAVYAVAVDSAGNAYVTGSAGTGFPVTTGAYQAKPNNNYTIGGSSVFVTKFDPSGNVVYSTYLGGSVADVGLSIAVDAAGNAYIAGCTASPDFPVTAGAFQTVDKVAYPPDGPQCTGFVSKLNPTGTALVYSTFLGGSKSDVAQPQAQGQEETTGIAVDSSGNAYVTGYTFSTDFPTTPGAIQSVNPGTPNQAASYFVTKLNSTGSALVYSTYLGGDYYGGPPGIAIDSAGSAYIAGVTNDGTFPTTSGAYDTKYSAEFSMATLSKLNSTGTALVYSTYLGGSIETYARAVAVDASGDAYVTGSSSYDGFPITTGAVNAPDASVFVTKFNPAGSALLYSAAFGQSPNDIGQSIALNSTGDAFVSGVVGVPPFPLTPGAFQTEAYFEDNAIYGSFVAKLNGGGSALDYSTYLSGTGSSPQNYLLCDCINGIAVDSVGNAVVAGQAWSADFPTTIGAFEPGSYSLVNLGGTIDLAFVTKFNGSEMTSLPLTSINTTENANPQWVIDPVVLTANVTPASGSNVPTGSVFFSTDAGILCNAPLDSSGTATCTTSVLHDGPNPIRVTYYGDANDAPSNADVTETIQRVPTTTSLSGNQTTVTYGTSAAFTAQATATLGTGTPPAGFIFSVPCASMSSPNGGTSGATTCATATNLPIGTYSVSAAYQGNDTYAESTSNSLPLTVEPLGVTPIPTFAPPGGTYSQTVQVTLTDSTENSAIYYTVDGSTPLVGSGTLYGGPFSVGVTTTVNAIAIAPGYSPSVVESITYVLPPNFTLSLSSASLFVQAGQPATDVITIGPEFGFTGQVSFSCSGLPSGTSCSFSPTMVTPASGNSTTTTLTISTTTAAALEPGSTKWLPITSLALVLGAWGFRKRRGLGVLLLVVGVSVAVTGVSSCGGGSGGGNGVPQEVISTVTVTGTSGSIQNSATTTVTLTK